MDKALEQIINSELLSEENKAQIAELIKQTVIEAKAEQEKKLREHYAKMYDADREQIAEAVQQYIEQRMDAEVAELRSNIEGLEKQRIQYAEMKESITQQARTAVKGRLELLQKVVEKALSHEVSELREDMKTNRKAVLQKIAEVNARGEADRKAFKQKAAAVLEHIATTRITKEIDELRDDIKRANENDFGRRIFEAFMGEARLNFFNASAEHRALLQKIKKMDESHKAEVGKLNGALKESQVTTKKALAAANRLNESIKRKDITTRLLATVPAGSARSSMKSLLENTAVKDLESTFKKFIPNVLNESRKPAASAPIPAAAVSVRTGSQRQEIVESAATEADDDIKYIRRMAHGSGK